MKAAGTSWQGLKPEQDRFMIATPCRQKKRVTWRMVLRVMGGYAEPRWLRDHRPQPLRSRMTVWHLRTLLRREAVARLRMEGKSFRQIGRELGVSQVAAWKLWQQLVADLIEQAFAERRGVELLHYAWQKHMAGNRDDLRKLWSLVHARFGSRVANRFVGPLSGLSSPGIKSGFP